MMQTTDTYFAFWALQISSSANSSDTAELGHGMYFGLASRLSHVPSCSTDVENLPEVWHPDRPHHVHRVGQGPRRPGGHL